MRKKCLSVLLALAIALTLAPVSALAADTRSVPNEITTIKLLAEALEADEPTGGSDVVTLRTDVTIDKILRINCDATIELSGHTLKITGGYVRIDSGNTVKFTNIGTGTTAGAVVSNHGTAAIIAMRGSTLELGEVRVENTENGYGIMVNPNPTDAAANTTVTLDKTLIKTEAAGGVYVHGNLQTDDIDKTPVITLLNAKIVSGGAGMYLAGSSNTTVTGNSEITGATIGIGIKAGKLDIKGNSKIEGNGTYVESPGGNGNGINGDGSALEVEVHSGYGGNIQVTIEDQAELISKNGHPIHVFKSEGGSGTKPVFEINGGTFTGAAGKEAFKANKDEVTITVQEDGWQVLPQEPQTIEVRENGVEDDDTDVNYEEAYTKAGLTLGARENDGSYTLTIDKDKLERVFNAGRNDPTFKILENKNNPYQLWFGMNYNAPDTIKDQVKSASVKFDNGEFAPITLETKDGKGFYNYIKVYTANKDDGLNGSVVPSGTSETATIKWLGENGTVLAVTKAVIKIDVTEPEPPKPEEYAITFNANGGTFDLNGETVTQTTMPTTNQKLSELPVPVREGYTFKGWYMEVADGSEVKIEEEETTFTASITVYAHWEEDNPDNPDTENPDGEPETFTVKFDSQGGSEVPGAPTKKGETVKRPPDPTRDGYTFGGWYKDKECKDENVWDFETDTVTKETTLYAKWTEDTNVTKYKVTFDSLGGSEVEEVTVEKGETVKKPTDPTRDGYTFKGWYKDKGYKELWDFEKDTVTENVTLYAKWEKNTSSGGDHEDDEEYEIWVRSGIRHGSIYLSRWFAQPGDWVTITVDPDTDYFLDWIEAVGADGWRVYLRGSGDRYTFIMPDCDVTIDAVFALEDAYSIYHYQYEEPAQATVYVPTFTPPAQRPTAVFHDLYPTSWAYRPAQWAYQNGYLSTAYDGTFRLNDPVSNRHMWKIMAQWLNAPVSDDREIENWAVQIGAARGKGPDAAMTRQDMVLYLHQCYFLMGGDVSVTGNLASYLDGRLITMPAAKNAWLWAVSKGIVSGTADGYLNPNQPLNRGEFAQMLMLLCENMTK